MAKSRQPAATQLALPDMAAAPAKPAKKTRRREPPTDVETLDETIADLRERLTQLAEMIDRLMNETEQDELLVKVFAQHAQSASRLGRLLRDRRALSGEAADGFAGGLGAALDELASLWGRDDL